MKLAPTPTERSSALVRNESVVATCQRASAAALRRHFLGREAPLGQDASVADSKSNPAPLPHLDAAVAIALAGGVATGVIRDVLREPWTEDDADRTVLQWLRVICEAATTPLPDDPRLLLGRAEAALASAMKGMPKDSTYALVRCALADVRGARALSATLVIQ